ncbi:MAG: glycosyltransferase family 39 protein [Pseudomonadota bacterium]
MGSFSGRLLLAAAGLSLAFRFWLAAVMPITGDEAYFIWWGKVPDWGFYDHPPLIGWWLAALLTASDAEWWLRLPQVLQPLLLALAVRWAWPHLWPDQRDYCDWVALLILLAPMNVWNVFITTDTALVYCAVLSGLAWLRATQDNSKAWYLVAGIFLAGAVLSKYFAALLGFAYLVDALRRRTPRAFTGLAIAYACTVPALLLMAWWNSEHCWTNYLFNFVNRHGKGNTGLNLSTPLLYPLMLLYILTPPVMWTLLRRPSLCRPASADFSLDRSLLVLAAVPLLLFALLSLVKTIGLHWVLSFVPFVLMLVARRLMPRGIQKLTVFFFGFAALHVALAVTVSRLPLETWRNFNLYPSLVLTVDSATLVEHAMPGDTLLASDGYSNAVTLGYNLRRYVPVLGPGSGHARHDDVLTDWRAHDGRDITVLRKTVPRDGEYADWFRSVSVDSFEHRGARFWVVRGQGFDYARYRDTVLTEIRRKYYGVPSWLPLSNCYFCERYFPDNPCRR